MFMLIFQEYGLNFGMLNVNAKPSFSSSLSPTVASPMSLSNEKIVDIFDPIQVTISISFRLAIKCEFFL